MAEQFAKLFDKLNIVVPLVALESVAHLANHKISTIQTISTRERYPSNSMPISNVHISATHRDPEPRLIPCISENGYRQDR